MRSHSRKCSATLVFLLATGITLNAQIFKTLVEFDGVHGGYPEYGSLVQGVDGSLYGTTLVGGGASRCIPDGCGTIFKVTPTGVLTTLYDSCENCVVEQPTAGLTLASDGAFYGTAGSSVGGFGTVFKITRNGVLTILYVFCKQGYVCLDGAAPSGGVIEATDGNFYGVTSEGGPNCAVIGGCGTMFRITPTGTLTTIHNFCNQPGCADGSTPFGGLIQGVDGNLYGTTTRGGRSGNCVGGCGTVFKATLDGLITPLYSFDYYDGANPTASLIQGNDGNFYGTTAGVVASNGCFPCGSVFQMTPAGKVTILWTFGDSHSDSYGSLIQATDGNFYGTTYDVPGNGFYGSIFEVASGGSFKTVYLFCGPGCPLQGTQPFAGLTQSTNGMFYGTTNIGGSRNFGTIYVASSGLAPFVAFVRNSARVGQTLGILGQAFTGATEVSLNGSPIDFSVPQDTFIQAPVPAGATTGPVTVTTPTGTLTSNVPFRVLPQLLSFTPSSGPVGTQVTVTGVSLTQTTGVGFGDYTPAPFTVNSDTQVTATVPSGAQTGPVGVQTQGGIAISTQTFTVTP